MDELLNAYDVRLGDIMIKQQNGMCLNDEDLSFVNFYAISLISELEEKIGNKNE